MRKALRNIAAAFGATFTVAAAGVGVFYLTNRDGWNKRAYDRIHPGMTRAEAIRALGEEPDCVVSVGRSEAWFYRGSLGDVTCRTHVAQVSELPTLYGTLQLLIGQDGKVRAVAMDGERSLRTSEGDQFASTLRLLSNSEVE
jgi:hypothetical protein